MVQWKMHKFEERKARDESQACHSLKFHIGSLSLLSFPRAKGVITPLYMVAVRIKRYNLEEINTKHRLPKTVANILPLPLTFKTPVQVKFVEAQVCTNQGSSKNTDLGVTCLIYSPS